MEIDWKRKLTSRKFWMAIAGFIAGIVVLVCGNNELATEISALVLSAASVVAYIVGEGLSDASYNNANTTNTTVTENNNANFEYYSQVDGNEEEVLAGMHTKVCRPIATGRDGITIDGNEEEGE